MRNQPLTASFATISLLAPLILVIGLVSLSSASAGDPVYMWKDSSGQSHYSQTPPEGQKFKILKTSGRESANAYADETSTDANGQKSHQENPNPTKGQTERKKYCDAARVSVNQLENSAAVKMDINGDGKAVNLTAEQQSQQLENARKQVSVLCED